MKNLSNFLYLLALFLSVFVFLAAPTTTQQAPKTFECGRSTSPLRIVDGYDVTPGEWPWMAHIEMIQSSNGQLLVCGGTLISDRHVLTAAHCMQNEIDGEFNRILNITLGASDVYNDLYARQQFGWKRIVIPTNWTLENDMAIITLSKPVNLTDYVRPACLPFEDDWDHVDENVHLTGWGIHNESNTFSPVLRVRYYSRVISSLECQEKAGIGYFSGDNVICSDGYRYYSRYYHGDDGGPTNYYNSGCGRWFVIGVAGRGELFDWSVNWLDIPNKFTRVRAHLDFIRSHTGVASPTDCSAVIESTTSTPKTTTTPTRPTTTPKTTTTPTTSTTTPTTTTTESTTTTPTTESTTKQLTTFDCMGKPNGNYPNPVSTCSNTFYMCSNGNTYLYDCAGDLVYREDIGVCDWPYNVAGCR